ncbi:hypothetical protein BKA70DRAFT_1308450 [Coprinopsis sp. MPI-PUGE-AT-0042]|nr:hypothetical protein BKA70DRAFT_1308450 [Coprinopsis sp. MPI-PUGE-AT-0042]
MSVKRSIYARVQATATRVCRKAVEEGDMEKLLELHQPATILSVTDVYLEFLQACHIPSPQEIDSRSTVALAKASHGLFAIRGLDQLLYAAAHLQNTADLRKIRRMTADKVKSALDDITKWLSFAVSNNPASYLGEEFGTDCGFTYLASRTAMNLGALHEGPDSFAAYANQALVDLLIEIWLKKNGDVDFNFPERGPPSDYYIWGSPGPRGLIDRAPGQGCWLISVIRCLVNTPELSTLFCHRWLSRCTAGGLDPSALFISTIHSRLTQSVSASDMGKDLLYSSVCDITALSHLIHCVTVPYLKDRTKQPRWGPTLLQALYKSGNVCKFTKAIRCLSDQCLEMEVTDGFPEPEGTAFEPVVLCAKVIDDLFIKDLNTFPNAISNSFRTLVRHGLLQIAGNAAFALSRHTQAYRARLPEKHVWSVDHCYRCALLFSIAFPAVSHELILARHALPPEMLIGHDWAMRNILDIKLEGEIEPWSGGVFWEEVELYHKLHNDYRKTISRTICDSATVSYISSGPGQLSETHLNDITLYACPYVVTRGLRKAQAVCRMFLDCVL